MKIKKYISNSKVILFIILFALCSMNVMAQKSSLEFSIHGGGSFDVLAFAPLKKGNSSAGYGAEIGMGFSGFFSPQFGIYVGVGFNFMNIKSKLDTLKHVTSGLIKKDDLQNLRKYDLHTSLIDYTEVQRSMFITIPVMLQYQTKLNQHWDWRRTKNVGFYFMGGAKAHFLVNNKYETTVRMFKNLAHFTDMGVWINGPEYQGFGTFDNNTVGEGKLNFGFMLSVALETGVKWRIDRNIFLYTGIYFDCGVNDPFKDSRKSLANYTKKEDFKELTLLKAADRVNMLAVGIKVKVAFGKTL